MKFKDALKLAEDSGIKVSLLDQYQGTKQLLQMTCSAGHLHVTTRNNFCSVQAQRGCPECRTQRYDTRYVEFVRHWEALGYSDFKKEGSLIYFKNPNGVEERRTYLVALKSKQLSTRMRKEDNAARLKKNLQKLEAEGYLHRTLKGRFIELTCPVGHVFTTNNHKIRAGYRCGHCRGSYPDTYWLDLKKEIQAEGWTVLTEIYPGHSKLPLSLKDPNGKMFELSADEWQRGYRKTYDVDFKDIKAEFAAEGFELLETTYINSTHKMKVRCRQQHEFLTSLNFLRKGVRCSVCNANTSKLEQEFLHDIRKLYPSAKKEYIDGVEIDIFIPELQTGIEVCGLFFHSEAVDRFYPSSTRNSKKRHFNKYKHLKERGVRLLTVFEDELNEKRTQILERFKPKTKINARDCVFNVLPKNKAVEFLDQYHLQGASRRSLYHFGLHYKTELVGVMTFAKHHRRTDPSRLILDRLCFGQYTVRGGASRLFSNALKTLPQHIETIISWSDNRFHPGSVYPALGFIKAEELPPDYSYCNVRSLKRSSKQALKKTSSEQKLKTTEAQLRSEQGWYRIWDCGKIRWEYKI